MFCVRARYCIRTTHLYVFFLFCFCFFQKKIELNFEMNFGFYPREKQTHNCRIKKYDKTTK